MIERAPCPTCKGVGARRTADGGFDACLTCAREAELQWLIYLANVERETNRKAA